MDVRLFLTTFAAIFLAELGDKTQLATFTAAAGSPSKLTIFLASASALVMVSAISVIGAEALSKAVPADYLQKGAGILFIVLGLFYLISKPS